MPFCASTAPVLVFRIVSRSMRTCPGPAGPQSAKYSATRWRCPSAALTWKSIELGLLHSDITRSVFEYAPCGFSGARGSVLQRFLIRRFVFCALKMEYHGAAYENSAMKLPSCPYTPFQLPLVVVSMRTKLIC